jgi:hypothetical protein
MPQWINDVGGTYVLIALLVMHGGIALVFWGLWGSRSKGRPRCPKCWLDMRATLPQRECPDCGHTPKDERGHYKDRRRWFAVVVGLVVAVSLLYPTLVIKGWYGEQATIEQLEQRGHVDTDGVTIPKIDKHWLASRLPESLARFFERVKAVSFKTSADDADLELCGRLGSLVDLGLDRSQVTDAGLAHLSSLVKLGWLDLSQTQISDAGLQHLAGLTGLGALKLDGTGVTDAGLVHLQTLGQLKALELRSTQVTGSGMVHLVSLPNLMALNLASTPVTDDALVHLGQMASLTSLILDGTKVTDAGLAHLTGLTNLRGLNLAQTAVTFDGVQTLSRALPRLKVQQ